MPFVMPQDRSRNSPKHSFFSAVQGWEIPSSHLRINLFPGVPRNQKPCVAVKNLNQPAALSDSEFKSLAEAEADALELIRKLDHPHLTKAIAYYTKGKEHFFMFPWADGGNLRDFWRKPCPSELTYDYIEWIFGQLCGLAGAIERLHSCNKGACRHGDLKAENILCFEDMSKDSSAGAVQTRYIFAISDVGLAKQHNKATEFRNDPTRAPGGTMTYQPPEAQTLRDKPRTRRYDIWSLGCIYLEFAIWLLYGNSELERFQRDIDQFYVIKTEGNPSGSAQISPVVQNWIDFIKSDARCPSDTALGRLIDLVETRLLVTNVGKDTNQQRRDTFSDLGSQEGSVPILVHQATDLEEHGDLFTASRAYAEEMAKKMRKIYEDATLGTKPAIQWIKWDKMRETPRHGPLRKYGDRLATSHASADGPAMKNQQDVSHQKKRRDTFTQDAD